MLVVHCNVSNAKPWPFNSQALGYTRRLFNYFTFNFGQMKLNFRTKRKHSFTLNTTSPFFLPACVPFYIIMVQCNVLGEKSNTI